MKIISLKENKNYRSDGYAVALEKGDGLIAPFCKLDQPLTIDIGNIRVDMGPNDNVYICEKADKVFKDFIREVLFSDLPQEKKKEIICCEFDKEIHLLKKMWVNGLFDLDTNLLNDIGYFKDKLMVIDPGEMVDNIEDIPIEAETDPHKRSDYSDLEGILKKIYPKKDDQNFVFEILKEFSDRVKYFFEGIKNPEARKLFGISEGKKITYKKIIDPNYIFDNQLIKASSINNALQNCSSEESPFYFNDNSHLTKLPNIKNENMESVLLVQADKKKMFLNEPAMRMTGDGAVLPLIKTILAAKENCFILDAGKGYRSGLLGLAAGSKGSLLIKNKPLYKYIDASIEILKNKLPENHILLVPSDTLYDFSNKDIKKIESYFSLTNKPGIFFFDLPESGQSIIPTSNESWIRYLESEARPRIKEFIDTIFPLKGMLKEGVVDLLYNSFISFLNEELKNKDIADYSNNIINIASSSKSLSLSNIVPDFLRYNTAFKGNGTQPPFLMIFDRKFLNTVEKRLRGIIPEYADYEITWHQLLSGMKSSRYLFQNIAKPDLISEKKWNEIFNELQIIKKEFNIDFDNEQQNVLRVFEGKWTTVDTPSAYYDLLAKNESLIIENSHPDLKAEITGKQKTIIYGVNNKKIKNLRVESGQVIVQLGNEIFSMNISKTTKKELAKRMVYKLLPDGTFKEYLDYEQFYRMCTEHMIYNEKII